MGDANSFTSGTAISINNSGQLLSLLNTSATGTGGKIVFTSSGGDILVNGGPWNTRIAVQVHDYIADPGGGTDIYANRGVLLLTIRWGRLVRWEDYEDTERVAAWDRATTAPQAE